MNESTNGWMDGWMDGRMDRLTDDEAIMECVFQAFQETIASERRSSLE